MPYLTPEELPEGDICRPLYIPNNADWMAIVSGAITELTKAYNWQAFGAVTVDEAVQRMMLMAEQYYDIPCCPVLFRVGEEGVLEESLDGGETWGTPSGDAEIPELPERTEPTEEERRCAAAANAANVLGEVYEVFIDAWNTDHSINYGVAAFTGIWATLVGVWLGVITAGAIPLLWGVFGLAYQALEFLFADAWDEAFNDKIKCILYECATDTDGKITFNYDCFISAINELANGFDVIEGRLGVQINYMMLFIGATGLNHAGATTAITGADCADCDGWQRDWLDGNGLRGELTLIDRVNWSGLPACTPTYEAIEDWITSCLNGTSGGARRSSCAAELTFTATTITFLEAQGYASNNESGTSALIIRGLLAGVEVINVWANGQGNKIVSWTGSQSVDTIQVIARAARTGTITPTARIDKLVVGGIGDNPFE